MKMKCEICGKYAWNNFCSKKCADIYYKRLEQRAKEIGYGKKRKDS